MGCGDSKAVSPETTTNQQPPKSKDPEPDNNTSLFSDDEPPPEHADDSQEIERIKEALTQKNLLVSADDLHLSEFSLFKSSNGRILEGELNNEKIIAKCVETPNLNMEAFLYEADDILRYSHPNIIPLKAVCLDPPILVFPFYNNGNLRTYLYGKDMKTLAWTEKKQILIQLCQAIQTIHNDSPHHLFGCVSSLHVLLDEAHKPTLSGFGGSFRIRLMTPLKDQTSDPLKLSSLTWTAPELIGNESQLTSKMDIFSLAIVMYEILFQQDPYEGMTQKQLMAAILRQEIVRPSIPDDLPEGVSVELIEMMKECWDELPENRPSIEDVLELFESLP
ncbi:putative Dual specificity protein kinase pyk3 [Blattamonas nauphoetae]|uniref:Dual specificity protein kinase pyk3 n=1 Tax=Blattamonas nauphoetae TaxID=2049346 RepID=A0ABQ9Y2B4_9EUKA|nr:putative Dual specificity protein kinase pyk3 [Blattamonas nauphoetae]